MAQRAFTSRSAVLIMHAVFYVPSLTNSCRQRPTTHYGTCYTLESVAADTSVTTRVDHHIEQLLSMSVKTMKEDSLESASADDMLSARSMRVLW